MIYWDTSALVPILIREEKSDSVLLFLEQHQKSIFCTSFFTFLEIESAIRRRLNDKTLNLELTESARKTIIQFRRHMSIMHADESLLDAALHYQKIYGLRAGDALHLASARASSKTPLEVQFMCLDRLLNQAALQEGFCLPANFA